MVNLVLETLWGCFVSSTLRVFLVHVVVLALVRPHLTHYVGGISDLADSLDPEEEVQGATYLYRSLSPACCAAGMLSQRDEGFRLAAALSRLGDEDAGYFLQGARPEHSKSPFVRMDSLLRTSINDVANV